MVRERKNTGKGATVSEPHYSMPIEWTDEDYAYYTTLPHRHERVLGLVAHGKDALEGRIASAPNSMLLHKYPRGSVCAS